MLALGASSLQLHRAAFKAINSQRCSYFSFSSFDLDKKAATLNFKLKRFYSALINSFSFFSPVCLWGVCLCDLCLSSLSQPSSLSTCVYVCVFSLQAVGWSSCWFSVGSSFPGPAPVTVYATLHPAPSPAKPITSCQSPKAFLLTVSASSYRTIRSIAYFGATSAPTRSLSGSTPITSHTLNRPPSTASRCSRSWIWETTATCAPWLKTPFTG